MRSFRIFSILLGTLALMVLSGWNTSSVKAGTITLNNNSGDTSSSFFVDGEATLVMNGFDLQALNVGTPAVIDVVTIAVEQAVAGAAIQVVIYEDANGGSPIDATLVSQTQVFIETGGTAFITLPEPVTINAPVVWVGFYLPVGFRFFGDDSGSSVFSYWAWTPTSTFNLSDLSSAAVLGPADGSDPVQINMEGVARITAEITPPNSAGFTGDGQNTEGIPIGIQIDGGSADLSILDNYEFCGDRLLFDSQDIEISARDRFSLHCRADLGSFSPGTFVNQDELPNVVSSFERRGFFYEVFVNGETAPASSEKLLVPVTHCLRPEQGEVSTAVIGVAYGAPRQWEMLPTVRYGEWVCAEVTYQGFLSYFVPRVGDVQPLNADLYFVSTPYLAPEFLSSPDGLLCGYNYTIVFAVRNEGFVPTPETTVRFQFINDRTGTLASSVDIPLLPMAPGETRDISYSRWLAPIIFYNETHTITYTIDPSNVAPELDENNNSYRQTGTLLLQTAKCR
jgi:CARDB protein